MLPYAVRRALFFLFVGIFIISAPLVVLYTAGYRFNRGNNTVLQTGTLAIASTPKGATTFVNGEDIQDATPAVLQRLSPGTRTVALTKKGYYSWERTVSVTSGSTTYITAPLFLAEDPQPLTKDTRAWTEAMSLTSPEQITLPERVLLLSTPAGIEVHVTTLTSSTFVALLSPDTYTPLVIDGDNLFVQNSSGETFFISLSSVHAPQSLGKEITNFAWDSNEQLFAWTDGLEVHIFHPSSGLEELVTRQSDPVVALGFAHNGESIVIASGANIIGIDLVSYTDGRMQTLLTSFTEPTTVWFAKDGSVAYLETASTLSSLALTP